jgi:hypothetical protein
LPGLSCELLLLDLDGVDDGPAVLAGNAAAGETLRRRRSVEDLGADPAAAGIEVSYVELLINFHGSIVQPGSDIFGSSVRRVAEPEHTFLRQHGQPLAFLRCPGVLLRLSGSRLAFLARGIE